ncbi:hypothetical protein E2C01_081857 [Portunus trituberculatus]|uniref:Uncharacterized protein n=1 Tax=Portunus trituberculatus TaxID=210409 RepID=A0A5B7IXK3_PORTR|nr:hypothetical protein [Portunus trituberculatus]
MGRVLVIFEALPLYGTEGEEV